ncbi:MAG: MarR family transcriptional regulator [Neisseriaceae bacterium]|nr:MarR family transcriptional regulator [Neisseriaceae bacterium]
MKMNISFTHVEKTIERINQAFPNTNKKRVVVGRLFHHITPRLTQYLSECLKPFGLDEHTWLSLLALYACDQHTLSPTNLSELLDASRTSATRVADELVKNDWVARTYCDQDRRKILLTLTPAGHELINHVIPALHQEFERLWSDFEPAELDLFEGLMRKLLSRLGG